MIAVLLKILFYLSALAPALVLFDGIPLFIAAVVLCFISNFPLVGTAVIFIAQLVGLFLGSFSSTIFLVVYLLLMAYQIFLFFTDLKGMKG